ncbi:MAG: baseplate J/gp47 family protein [Anaerolineae bacterium]|nr:baseplate J/gp47 family protein [Anaerolineae bacterium]
MTAVIHLQEDDDLAVLRDHLRQAQDQRVALVLPWDARFLADPLDCELVRREAERTGVQVAIVSQDPERRAMIRRAGLAVFSSADGAAAAARWRQGGQPVAPPPRRAWWEEKVSVWPPPRSLVPSWLRHVSLGARVVIFIATMFLLFASAYIVVPHATVTLVPADDTVEVIVPISVSLEAETVDTAAGVVPARRIGDYIDGYIEVETTGTAAFQSGRAVGTVLFTNLLGQDVVVPVGTVVRTSSSSFPVRFATTQQSVAPAFGQVLVPVEALAEGLVGNVTVNQINQIEGTLSLSLRVTNPDPTHGGAIQDVRAASQEDRDRARELLIDQLLAEAFYGLQDCLEPTEFMPRQSLVVQSSSASYTRFLNERADTLGLHMRLLITGLAVDRDNAETVAYATLARQVPDGYHLIETHFEIGEMSEELLGDGEMVFFVTATGYTAAEIDVAAAKEVVRGMPTPQAIEQLEAGLPLADVPQIQVWPEWLGRMPLLPLRMTVYVVPRGPTP